MVSKQKKPASAQKPATTQQKPANARPGAPKRYPPIPRPYETDEDNVVRQAQAKGKVRPDGPGDETAPVEPERRARR